MQHRSTPKSVCDGLQELTKKKIDKAKAKEENSSKLYNLKIAKAKLDFQASEVTLEILKTELATKKIEMETKIKQARLNEDILLIKKQKLEINN